SPWLIAPGSSMYGFPTRLVGVPFGIIIPHIVGSPAETAAGWRNWFYVCIGCVVAFVPFIFTMYGRWSPRRAREDYEARQHLVAHGIERLHGPPGPPLSGRARAPRAPRRARGSRSSWGSTAGSGWAATSPTSTARAWAGSSSQFHSPGFSAGG